MSASVKLVENLATPTGAVVLVLVFAGVSLLPFGRDLLGKLFVRRYVTTRIDGGEEAYVLEVMQRGAEQAKQILDSGILSSGEPVPTVVIREVEDICYRMEDRASLLEGRARIVRDALEDLDRRRTEFQRKVFADLSLRSTMPGSLIEAENRQEIATTAAASLVAARDLFRATNNAHVAGRERRLFRRR